MAKGRRGNHYCVCGKYIPKTAIRSAVSRTAKLTCSSCGSRLTAGPLMDKLEVESSREEWIDCVRPRIYFAGKISGSDRKSLAGWRHQLGHDRVLPDVYDSDSFAMLEALESFEPESFEPDNWICWFDDYGYCGPYFVGCDHRCFHGPTEHGVGAASGGCSGEGPSDAAAVYKLCRALVKHATHIFCWIDEPDCYGSIMELGWADPHQHVFIGFPSEQKQLAEEMWFVSQRAFNRVVLFDNVESAFSAFMRVVQGDGMTAIALQNGEPMNAARANAQRRADEENERRRYAEAASEERSA